MDNKLAYQESIMLSEFLNIIDQKKLEIDSFRPLHNLNAWSVVQEKLRADWVYNSNAIEGSTLTQSETIFFLKEGLTVEGKPFKDFLDAQNHAEAIDFMYEVIKDERPITEGLLKQINALLMKGISYTEAIDQFGNRTKKKVYLGEFKRESNSVLTLSGNIHKYVDPLQVQPQIDELLHWVTENKDNLNPVIIGAIAHYNFVRIHPFDDGNGRGARILLNLILIKGGYPPTIIKVEHRRKYLEALEKADNGDLTPFIEFVAESLIHTQEVILNSLKQAT